jgi:hypothetical protein
MTEHSYEEGLRDGRIDALERMVSHHNDRLDHHERRLQMIERIIYAMVGALALVELLPALKGILS